MLPNPRERPLRFAARASAIAIACSVSSITTAASATVSAITVNTAGITRTNSDGSYYPSRIVEGSSQGIGFVDCTLDTNIVFPLTITGLPDSTVTFEIWAGTGDCTAAGATNNASTGTCWPVSSNPTPQAVMSIPIRVQDIVSELGVSPPPQSYSSATSTVCTSAASSTTTTVVDPDSGAVSTTSGLATVSIFFMFFPTGTSTPSITASPYPLKVKLSGPAACSNVTAGSGDGLLLVNWDPPADETDIQGYYIYASPSGSGGTGDGGGSTITVCPDAGQDFELVDDAGNPILDDAGNPILVDDAGNPFDPDAGCYSQYVPPTVSSCTSGGSIDTSSASTCGDGGTNGLLCSQVNGTTNGSGKISGLTNGQSYAIAVAAFDEFGNTGSLSNVVCSAPAPINDFWKIYNQDGGSAFCALDVVGAHGSPIGAVLVSGIAIVLLRRRRRKKE